MMSLGTKSIALSVPFLAASHSEKPVADAFSKRSLHMSICSLRWPTMCWCRSLTALANSPAGAWLRQWAEWRTNDKNFIHPHVKRIGLERFAQFINQVKNKRIYPGMLRTPTAAVDPL